MIIVRAPKPNVRSARTPIAALNRRHPKVAIRPAVRQESSASWRGVDRRHERRCVRPDAGRHIIGAVEIPNSSLSTPEVLDVRERPEATLTFMRHVRQEARRRRVRDGLRDPSLFELKIDAERLDTMCLASALMLLAERELAARTAGRKIMIAGGEVSPPNLDLLLEGGAQTFGAVSGHIADGAEFLPLLDRLHALPDVIDPHAESLRFYDGLMDAALNAVEHAYPARAAARRDAGLPLWWAAAAYEPARRCMQICVYDQGVGIPATIARDPYYADFVRGAHSDADKIELAITFAEEGRAVDGKGRGLSRMLGLVGHLPFASSWILSGHGQVRHPRLTCRSPVLGS